MAPFHSATSRTAQGIHTPYKSSKEKSQKHKIPKTPSVEYKDTFDLTPGTVTTTSFADSGFYSSPAGDSRPSGTNYADWTLFPEDDINAGNGFLDTSGFFYDADKSVRVNYDISANNYDSPRSLSSSMTLSPYNSQTLSPVADHDPVHTVQQALQNYTISSSPGSTPPPHSPRPSYLEYDESKDDVNMLDVWRSQYERHEDLAFRLEQRPFPEREHLLLPTFRQQSRVRRHSGQSRKNRQRRD